VHDTEHIAKKIVPGLQFLMKADPFPHEHACRAAYLERFVPAQTPDKMQLAPARQNDAS